MSPNRKQRRAASGQQAVPIRHPMPPMPLPPTFWRKVFLFVFKWRIKFRSFRQPEKKAQFSITGILRACTGPGIIVAGWQVMNSGGFYFSYYFGVGIIYFGVVFTIFEALFEGAIRSRRILQFSMILSAILFGAVFTNLVVLIKAPLESDAYVSRDGDEGEVEGIPWSTKYTDLRVWINNNTNADYRDLKLEIQPDQWNHTARIVGNVHGCELNPDGKGRYVSLAT